MLYLKKSILIFFVHGSEEKSNSNIKKYAAAFSKMFF